MSVHTSYPDTIDEAVELLQADLDKIGGSGIVGEPESGVAYKAQFTAAADVDGYVVRADFRPPLEGSTTEVENFIFAAVLRGTGKHGNKVGVQVAATRAPRYSVRCTPTQDAGSYRKAAADVAVAMVRGYVEQLAKGRR